ncbi:MAG: AAA family ATPase, partial [Bdellovibrionota bacterium]
MASFRDLCFTPSEFANIARVDRGLIPELEVQGFLKTFKRRVGNVERKMIRLEDMQHYFQAIRHLPATPDSMVATATIPTVPTAPKFKIQMFYNVKGGTGKSTLTAQYVMRCAMLGFKVLAIDLDGQGHLTVNLDILDGHERPTVYDVLINDLPINEAIMNVAPGLDLIPASLGLCNIEIPLNNKPRR